jgi:hypothetical protein
MRVLLKGAASAKIQDGTPFAATGPTRKILAAARHVTAVRLIGNALTATASEIDLHTSYIRFSQDRVRESISNHWSCGGLPPVCCVLGIKLTTISRRFAASQLHRRNQVNNH